RTAGLLTGLRGKFLAGTKPSEEERRYLTNQIAKALMALGDWYLIRWQGYDASYRRRRDRFAALAPGVGPGPELVRPRTQADEFKCCPDYAQFAGGLAEIQQFYPDIELALVHSINLMAEGYAKNISDAMTLYLQHMSVDAAWVKADNALAENDAVVKPLLA